MSHFFNEVAMAEKDLKLEISGYIDIGTNAFYIGSIYPTGEDHCEVVLHDCKKNSAIAYAELNGKLDILHVGEING